MNDFNIKKQELENIYGKISPFEFKNMLISLATSSQQKNTHTLLDAGRGNPNWLAVYPREAFFTFGYFALSESRHSWNMKELTGIPIKHGISERLFKFLHEHSELPGTKILKDIINYGISKLNFDPDSYVYELTDAILGDNYPSPDKMLVHCEKVVKKYLVKEMKYNTKLGGDFDVFAVEGATAAICYIFDSLLANNLLLKGDKIAIMTPIFTPYLEIPSLPRYEFDVVYINADETSNDKKHTWQYSDSQLSKLCDKDIKALFVVNPSNPPSVAICADTINKLIDIVKNYNPNLMIISDDVYGTFVPEFKSLMTSIPYNTIACYSYSKYFGATGWRLGTLAIHKNNIFDKLISELPYDIKKRTNKRYSSMSTTPDKVPFINRIIADSRQVALNHTSGLSTPQQVQMAFFSTYALIDTDDSYKNLTIDICHKRRKLLFDSLGIEIHDNKYEAAYYTQFDLLELIEYHYGKEFVEYVKSNYKPIDVLFTLAKDYSIVLLSGEGFAGPEWSIRVSLANLYDEAYTEIGISLKRILDGYVAEWKNSINKK